MKFPFFNKKQFESAKDPVCHMDVNTDKPAGGTWEFNGTRYYFCGPGCNKAFQKEAEAYLSGEKRIDM